MKSPEELSVIFRERGKKVTPQRERIFQILHENDSHPTAESVYERIVQEMPSVSIKTVYQTLHELTKMGEISALDLGTGSSRYDPNVSQHHHLVCTSCHLVKDLYLEVDDVEVPVELAQGFMVGAAEITFRGLCRNCRQSTANV